MQLYKREKEPIGSLDSQEITAILGKMVFHTIINQRKRAYAYYLLKDKGLSYRKIAEFCQISPASVVRICQEGLARKRKTKNNGTGRPPVLKEREKAKFLRTFKKMRDENANVRVVDIARESQITDVSYRSLVRILNKAGCRCLRPRRKGVLSNADRRHRVRYAREAFIKCDENFWTDDVLIYFDALSCKHKQNPYRDALTPSGRVWRKANEGLKYTTKGSKSLPEGRRCHVMVGVAFSSGVIIAEEYDKMNGPWFAKFAETTLQQALLECAVLKNKEKLLFVMDNDPSQNSRVAKDALQEIGAELVKITPRSPDLNQIENVFHNVKRKILKEALKERIEKEDFTAFKERVLRTLANCSGSLIDGTMQMEDTEQNTEIV